MDSLCCRRGWWLVVVGWAASSSTVTWSNSAGPAGPAEPAEPDMTVQWITPSARCISALSSGWNGADRSLRA